MKRIVRLLKGKPIDGELKMIQVGCIAYSDQDGWSTDDFGKRILDDVVSGKLSWGRQVLTLDDPDTLLRTLPKILRSIYLSASEPTVIDDAEKRRA